MLISFNFFHLIRAGAGKSYFCICRRVCSPPTLPVTGYRGISLGVKRPDREADHSPPSSAEVTNAWIYTSTPKNDFVAWCVSQQWILLCGVVLI
jgi:hypothetical protein